MNVRSFIGRSAMILNLVIPVVVQAGFNVHHARDGKTIIIDIAKESPNRIYVKGMRLVKIRAVKTQLQWRGDKKEGQFYIQPVNLVSDRPINFFLQDEGGNVYTVMARPKLIPAQSHQIVPRKTANAKPKSWKRSGSYPKMVAELIGHLYNHNTPAGYVSSSLERPILLWKETDYVLVRRIVGTSFIGETYRIKNIDRKTIVLHEQEFVKNAKARSLKIKGVAIDRHRLVPNTFTYVHLVRAK